jgi:hypothetical protein
VDEFHEVANEAHDSETNGNCPTDVQVFWILKARKEPVMNVCEYARPFCVGLVHRVKNCRSRNVNLGCSLIFEIVKTDLISITNELLGDLEKFLELVGHIE